MHYVFGRKARAVPSLLLIALLQLTGGCAAGDLLSRLHEPSETLDFAPPAAPLAVNAPTVATVDGPGGARPAPLLVVFTYGNGWNANSSGSGLRAVANAIRRQFPNDQVITRGCDDHDGIRETIENHRGPVALIGHSFGGCRSVEIATSVRHSIDWLILLDPVPCDDWAFSHPGRYFHIPASVQHATCFYRGAGMMPISYPIVNPTASMENRLRSLGHSEFCQNPEVRNCILDVCVRVRSGEFNHSGIQPMAVNH